jgi:hypothetical protein
VLQMDNTLFNHRRSKRDCSFGARATPTGLAAATRVEKFALQRPMMVAGS